MSPLLVAFAGLPGTGKTTLSRAVADRLGATYLRIDSIESAITASHVAVGSSPVGYVVAHQVAHDQLVAGRDVVVDAVHEVEVARAGWHDLATRTGATLRWVEVVCPDLDEHRRRVEGRTGDWPGHEPPTWDAVRDRAATWEPLRGERLLVEHVGSPDAHVEAVLETLRGDLHRRPDGATATREASRTAAADR